MIGHVQIGHFLDDVLAEAALVGERIARVVDTGVDRAAQVLQEGAEQAAVEIRARRDQAQRGVRGAAARLRVARQREDGRGGDTGPGETGL